MSELPATYDSLAVAYDALCTELAAANEARDALRAEVERLREDAERYRWLRGSSDLSLSSVRWARWEVRHWTGRFWDPVIQSDMDAAIDAARKPDPRMSYSKKDDPTSWNTDPYDTSTGMKIARPTRKE